MCPHSALPILLLLIIRSFVRFMFFYDCPSFHRKYKRKKEITATATANVIYTKIEPIDRVSVFANHLQEWEKENRKHSHTRHGRARTWACDLVCRCGCYWIWFQSRDHYGVLNTVTIQNIFATAAVVCVTDECDTWYDIKSTHTNTQAR